jgi:hypothetical protein
MAKRDQMKQYCCNRNRIEMQNCPYFFAYEYAPSKKAINHDVGIETFPVISRESVNNYFAHLVSVRIRNTPPLVNIIYMSYVKG